MDELLSRFNRSLQTGYVDKSVLSDLEFQPELLVNQKVPPRKVLSTILHELDLCSEFCFSVAFVTTSGVATIINKLRELENKGVKGRILVSQYLNFTEPVALRRLLQFSNIDLRITTSGNSHSKGYIFKCKDHYNLIVGSSNLTAQALATNKEWNIKISALNHSSIVSKVLDEFQQDFEDAEVVNEDYLSFYQEVYQSQKLFNREKAIEESDERQPRVSPNTMQQEALRNLEGLRLQNKNKALIISATGTGKTYLSAFDAKAFNPRRLLFVVHRLTIAKDALSTFRSVFGSSRSMGLFSGKQRELDCDFVFSTIQTISKAEHLHGFESDHFDYIIIDETHRSSADSYSRLIDHFNPKFLLGMTATPERSDGNDIFQLFDHNIAYEIRLSRAMEEEMLSTFHYYGVSDLTVENREIEVKSDFRYLVSSERVDRIIEKASFYGSDNGITRGLIFCSRKEEAIELSRLLNMRGLRTVALTGDSTEDQRAEAISLLETDELERKIDHILTVDIFNEGIDIPKINQIIMMRPTESAIIFIQQLGRGLRKVDSKAYLTVIDFIGNYENNYLIPIALYGDTSFNKDTLRRLVKEGSRMIPGASTINFDEITKERIFKSIDSANMQLFADLKKDYNLLKFKLGRTPMMMDFIEHGARDPYLFVDYSNSYYNFVLKVEKQQARLSKKEIKLLELFSKEINNSKRVEESIILKMLIEQGALSKSKLAELILNQYGYSIDSDSLQSFLVNLNFQFVREKVGGQMLSAMEVYQLDVIRFEEGNFLFSDEFRDFLGNYDFRRFLLDSTSYAIYQYNKLFDRANWRNGFILYRKYSRKDVFRILNVLENPVAQNVGGYLVSSDNKHCPIFVNYQKEEHISESIKYEDQFVNSKEFDWMSKSKRTLKSSDVQSILGNKGYIRLPLFIKKSNDEGTDFYYMGDVSPEMKSVEQTTMLDNDGKSLPVVRIRFLLEDTVVSHMYSYLHDDSKTRKENLDKIVGQGEMRGEIGVGSKERNLIPLYNFYAAAGSFSELQAEKNFKLIEAPADISSEGYFACRIVGESMNRVIPNGAVCLFRIYSGGSRNGKIVLVENRDIQDPDFNSAFTIKTYSSKKIVTADSYEHTSIVLKPNSFDNGYTDIEITEEKAEGMRVIGEFVRVL